MKEIAICLAIVKALENSLIRAMELNQRIMKSLREALAQNKELLAEIRRLNRANPQR